MQWTQSRLEKMRSDKVEESLNLDYKDGACFGRDKKEKIEITKDVSAMANSDGGTIIYGISEHANHKHWPGEFKPIDRKTFSKEWLEDVITNIRPRVDGIIIHPVSIGNSPDQVIYVVEIPKGRTAHQALDKRYYKRLNFKAEPMEDYEVRDVMNRISYPEIELRFGFEATTQPGDEARLNKLYVAAANVGTRYAKYINAIIRIPRRVAGNLGLIYGTLQIEDGQEVCSYYLDNRPKRMETGKAPQPIGDYDPLLPGMTMHLGIIEFGPPETVTACAKLDLKWSIHADDAPPRKGIRPIESIPISERQEV